MSKNYDYKLDDKSPVNNEIKKQCHQCKESSDLFLELSCNHVICMECAAKFLHSEGIETASGVQVFTCTLCGQPSKLDVMSSVKLEAFMAATSFMVSDTGENSEIRSPPVEEKPSWKNPAAKPTPTGKSFGNTLRPPPASSYSKAHLLPSYKEEDSNTTRRISNSNHRMRISQAWDGDIEQLLSPQAGDLNGRTDTTHSKPSVDGLEMAVRGNAETLYELIIQGQSEGKRIEESRGKIGEVLEHVKKVISSKFRELVELLRQKEAEIMKNVEVILSQHLDILDDKIRDGQRLVEELASNSAALNSIITKSKYVENAALIKKMGTNVNAINSDLAQLSEEIQAILIAAEQKSTSVSGYEDAKLAILRFGVGSSIREVKVTPTKFDLNSTKPIGLTPTPTQPSPHRKPSGFSGSAFSRTSTKGLVVVPPQVLRQPDISNFSNISRAQDTSYFLRRTEKNPVWTPHLEPRISIPDTITSITSPKLTRGMDSSKQSINPSPLSFKKTRPQPEIPNTSDKSSDIMKLLNIQRMIFDQNKSGTASKLTR